MKRSFSFLLVADVLGFLQSPSQPNNSCFAPRHHVSERFNQICDADASDDNREDETLLSLLKLSSSHFASQALHAAIRLNIPDVLGEDHLSLEEIASKLGENCNEDALLRTLRLLATLDVVNEEILSQQESKIATFSLTKLGKRFQSGTPTHPSMAACIQHWLERPLWNAWLELPSYIMGEANTMTPFAMANNGISSDFWYNEEDHPESLMYANDFVRLISSEEIYVVVNGFDWSRHSGKKLVDIGGYNGKLVGAIAQKEPTIDCHCFDLPEVIAKVPEMPNVTFHPGNILDLSTIPSCDAILMKHFLDRCMWSEDETIQILRNCHDALRPGGTLVIAEAVLPNHGNATPDNYLPLYMDALYMLVGREGQRTEIEWETLAREASFSINQITQTSVPSCSLIELTKI
jgi:SAM-dependent methyltransferase